MVREEFKVSPRRKQRKNDVVDPGFYEEPPSSDSDDEFPTPSVEPYMGYYGRRNKKKRGSGVRVRTGRWADPSSLPRKRIKLDRLWRRGGGKWDSFKCKLAHTLARPFYSFFTDNPSKAYKDNMKDCNNANFNTEQQQQGQQYNYYNSGSAAPARPVEPDF